MDISQSKIIDSSLWSIILPKSEIVIDDGMFRVKGTLKDDISGGIFNNSWKFISKDSK